MRIAIIDGANELVRYVAVQKTHLLLELHADFVMLHILSSMLDIKMNLLMIMALQLLRQLL